MNTCLQCGEGIPEGATVCARCGAPVLSITPPLPLQSLRHPLENLVFTLLAVVGGLSWLVLLVLTMGIVLPVGLALWFLNWVAIKMFRAHLLTHSVRVTRDHFPHIHRAVEEASQKLGFREPLEVYIMEGTTLNAFVAAMLRTRCMVLYSQLVEGIEEDSAALRGLVGHELAHFVLGHFRWRWLVMGAIWIPLLYLAWSRLCEYSADRCGQACAGDLQAYERVLATLAAGWRLARHVKPELLVAQANEAQNSVFARLIEMISTHPPLVKRVAEIRQFVLGTPQVTVERSAVTTLGAIMLLPFAGLQGITSVSVIALAFFALLAAILFPVFAQAREEARSKVCLSNLRQLSRAVQMYTLDYDDTLPTAKLETVIAPYVGGNMSVLGCPSDDTQGASSYSLNPGFLGWKTRMIALPARTVLLYDAEDDEPVLRHRDGLNLSCADGSVRWVSEPQIEEWIWEP